jgi:GDPmannose 4,6-dehydratase
MLRNENNVMRFGPGEYLGMLFDVDNGGDQCKYFFTSKIVKTAVQIKLGMATEIVLGNLDAERDWGHSRDYVRAMHLILNHSQPDDFVVATGETRSVRNLLEVVFSHLGMTYQDYVRQDPKYMRPEELPYLRGDSKKVREILGWKPTTGFNELVTEMTDFWLERLSSK